MTVESDGRPTISGSRGEASLQAAIGKPKMVEDAMQRKLMSRFDEALNFGAWRTLKTLRESIVGSKNMKTVADVLVIIESLEETYHDLYRAAQSA